MRFIGSKTLLLDDIGQIITNNASLSSKPVFCDIFAGTATVSRYFKKNFKIISNDLLHFSYVLQKATISNNKVPEFKRLGLNPFDFFSNISENELLQTNNKFIYENYSPTKTSDRKYFTNINAIRIDFIRNKIEEWYNSSLIEEGEFYYLLAGLIEAVPYISNIAGTYGAFLKHWDKRTAKPLELVKLEIDDNREQNICFNMDANKLIKEIRGDILYIDPPYNQRQYGPNYHLLETISRYDCPDIYGLTGMRKYEDIKSDYCVKNKVIQAFSDLIENAKFKNIVVSYSTEGIMTEDEVVRVLTECGGLKSTLKIKHIPYRRYKHMAGAVEHNLRELLFFIKKGNK